MFKVWEGIVDFGEVGWVEGLGRGFYRSKLWVFENDYGFVILVGIFIFMCVFGDNLFFLG